MVNIYTQGDDYSDSYRDREYLINLQCLWIW